MLASYELIERTVDIIKSHITFTYDTLEDMRSSIYLHESMTVKTLGYYAKRDGGGAYYIVEKKKDSDVDNGCDCIIVGYKKDLVAKFFPQNGVLNVLQFGIIQGSSLYDRMFNDKRMKYCEDYATDNGIGLLYPNKFTFRDGHQFGKSYGFGVIKSATSLGMNIEFSIPLPAGLVSQPVDRGIYFEGSFKIYSMKNSYSGTFTKTNHDAICNGISIMSTINVTGDFSSWSSSLQATVYVDFTKMYMKDAVIKA